MKHVVFFSLLLISTQGFAQSQVLNVKERLRIQLWVSGLDKDQAQKKQKEFRKPQLPEELERPLRNF